jgi:hypothetical protein
MPERPLLLLDVDGVLCPFGADESEPMRDLRAGGLTLRFAAALPDRLARLTREFDLVWATMWQQEANFALAPMVGLPQLPFIRFADVDAAPGRTWKLPAVRRHVRDRAFAWVDDDIGPDCHAWAQEREAPTLLLDVSSHCGLTDTDVDQLLAFAGRVNGQGDYGSRAPA